LAICAAAVLASAMMVSAQETNVAPQPIDLPTALRLAGAQNLDVQIARERVNEAKASQQSATAQFFPWISAGVVYRQHEQNLQDVQGNIVDVDKYSYAPGGALNAQVDLGEAWFKSLEAKQITQAALHGQEAQRQEAVLAAAQDYFDLAFAQGTVGVAAEAFRLAAEYENQLTRAVEAGVAFKGDLLRVRGQKQRHEITLRQAREQQRIAAAQLAQTLRLDPGVDLVALETDLAPLNLVTNPVLGPLVAQALNANPELKQGGALIAAARENQSGVTYGPMIPTISGQAFFGGLGGGRDGGADSFGGQQDYFVGASWRIGPGGLFDFTRSKASAARLKTVELGTQKLKDAVIRQVVESTTRLQSLAEQVGIAQRGLATAEEALSLAQQRKEFGVGIVLEHLQSEQDLTRARLDFLKSVAEFNQAQYQLLRLTGRL
jgi:outer membrane protein TolC